MDGMKLMYSMLLILPSPGTMYKVYHTRTNTYITIISSKLTWDKASLRCRNLKGPQGQSIQGHLVRIEATDMVALVRNILDVSGINEGWCGLYYDGSKYQWDGYKGQRVTFFRWFYSVFQTYHHPYTIVNKDKWWPVRPNYLATPICQYQKPTAVITTIQPYQTTPTPVTYYDPTTNSKPVTNNPVQETTDSKPVTNNPIQETTNSKPVTNNPLQETTDSKPVTNNPIQETTNSKPVTNNPIQETTDSKPVRAHLPLEMHCPPKFQKEDATVRIQLNYYTRDFNETRCYVNAMETPVVSCLKDEASCLSYNRFGIDMIRRNESVFSYKGYGKRPPNGRWSCQVINDKGRDNINTLTDSADFCEFQFYRLPKTLDCQNRRRPDNILIACTTFCVYPKAICEFSYKLEDADFKQFDDSQEILYNHLLYEDRTVVGNTYFRSNCSLVLTAEMPIFSTNYTIRVQMYPDIKNTSPYGLGYGTYDLEIKNPRLESVTISDYFLQTSKFSPCVLTSLITVLSVLLLQLSIFFLWQIFKCRCKQDIYDDKDNGREFVDENEENSM